MEYYFAMSRRVPSCIMFLRDGAHSVRVVGATFHSSYTVWPFLEDAKGSPVLLVDVVSFSCRSPTGRV